VRGDEPLLERLAAHARDHPQRLALREADHGWSWSELWTAALRYGGVARRAGIERGERALLCLPNGGEFAAAYLGIQLAGGVAVPLDPRSGRSRLRDVAGFTGARLLVAPEARRAELDGGLAETGDDACRVVAPGEGGAPLGAPVDVAADDLAMLQFTSGATGDPKGVELTHGCLSTNVAQLIEGLEISAEDRFVSWLPLSHDMGLVLMALTPLSLGAELDLLPTDATGLRRWLPTIATRRATFTAAPDFAYRLVRSWFEDRDSAPDIRSLRVALNAAEPVRPTTLSGFTAAFGLGTVMTPGYGLAEATVGVTTGRPGAAPRVDEHGLVALGRGLPGVELRVVDDAGLPLPPGAHGAIEVASPALCRGYFRNPVASAALFRDDGWLRTGDIGYLDSGRELYVAGRAKSVLFVGGLTLAPQEVEEAVERLPFVRRSAALGIDRGRLEGEQIHLFAEVGGRRRDESELSGFVIDVVAAIHERLGIRPGRVVLLRPGEIPRTETGKIRYQTLRDDFLAGTLQRRGGVLFPGSRGGRPQPPS